MTRAIVLLIGLSMSEVHAHPYRRDQLSTPIRSLESEPTPVLQLIATAFFVHPPKTGGTTFTMLVENGSLAPLTPCNIPLHTMWCAHQPCQVKLPNVTGGDGTCMATSEGKAAQLISGWLNVQAGVPLFTMVREPTAHLLSAFAHHKVHHHPNLTLDEYLNGAEREEQQLQAKHPAEFERAFEQTAAGLRRMEWVGVTEFYDESVCALRSLLASKPMCSCKQSGMPPAGLKVTHKTHPEEEILTGSRRARIMKLQRWRVGSFQYAQGLLHLRANLARFNLTCLVA
eukprot:scaffold10872_cov129-Isochrysis_galbana.AAC.6